MNITLSAKSPVCVKLVELGRNLDLDPAMLAAGMCHAALNRSDAAGSNAPAAPAAVAPEPPLPSPAPLIQPPPPFAPPVPASPAEEDAILANLGA